MEGLFFIWPVRKKSIVIKAAMNYAKEEYVCRQDSECGMIVSLPCSASSEL